MNPKAFLLGNVLPVLIFLAANVSIHVLTHPDFARLFERFLELDAPHMGLLAAATAIAIWVAARLLSSLKPLLRTILEGGRGRSESIRLLAAAVEQARLEVAERRVGTAASERREFQRLVESLDVARHRGSWKAAGATPMPADWAQEFALRVERVDVWGLVAAAGFEAMVDELAAVLEHHDAGAAPAGDWLDALHANLVDALERARSAWDAEHAEATWLSPPRTRGPDESEPRTAQLDFLVNCFWLTVLTTLAWLLWFAWHGFSAWHVTLVAIWGPVLMSAFHGLAVGELAALPKILRSDGGEVHNPLPGNARIL